jgi:hypothetical protein
MRFVMMKLSHRWAYPSISRDHGVVKDGLVLIK